MSPGFAPGQQGRRRSIPNLAATLALSAVAVACCTVRLSWPVQMVLASGILLLALGLHRASSGYRTTLFLVALSCYATGRYAVWRVRTVSGVVHGHRSHPAWVDVALVILLLAAETYTILNLGLGYLQMVWPLRRSPVPLPGDTSLWPMVDLLIPTLDEPLHIVKYTALAALHLDWPPERLNVYVLDDGNRDELGAFCAEAGIGYRVRAGTTHAKAGNLNAALEYVSAPFVAVFDADHAPVRSFLQLTLGWFDRDPKLAILQTPHHMYSPDPFERNLGSFRRMPNEGELFYGVVQDGNDLWNAAYFCGTGAILRRAALDGVGGFATETVTEDAHTSLRLQKRGWNTAYLNLPLAAGLATDRLRSHIGQRMRWARGMIQLLRIENPLFARGLSLTQRLCYLHATAYFLYALPRLLFLVAPLAFLIFGRLTLPGYWAAVLAFALPHLVLGYVASARLQGHHRHSFWNEVYETVLAPFLLWPTLQALFLPEGGRFNATVKGDVVHETFFDSHAAWPLLALATANLLGLIFAVLRLLPTAVLDGTGWTVHLLRGAYLAQQPGYLGAVWLNLGWTLFNLMILSVALGVARESRQRRRAVRLPKAVRAGIVLPDGTLVQGTTEDISNGGVLLRTQGDIAANVGEAVSLVLPRQGLPTTLPATVVETTGHRLRIQFDTLTLKEEEALAGVLFSPADAWVAWGHGTEVDRPLRSLLRVARLSISGVAAVFGRRSGYLLARMLVGVLCVGGCGLTGMLLATRGVRAQGSGSLTPQRASGTGSSASRVDVLRFSRLTPGGQTLELTEALPSRTLHFGIPTGEVVTQAKLHLLYLSDAALERKGLIAVSLNGVPVDLRPAVGTGAEAFPQTPESGIHRISVALPPELLVSANDLVLTLQRPSRCSDPDCVPQFVRVDPRSAIDLIGTSLSPAKMHPLGSATAPRPSLPTSAPFNLGAGEHDHFQHVWSAVLVGPVGVTACFLLALLWRQALRRRAGLRLELGGARQEHTA